MLVDCPTRLSLNVGRAGRMFLGILLASIPAVAAAAAENEPSLIEKGQTSSIEKRPRVLIDQPLRQCFTAPQHRPGDRAILGAASLATRYSIGSNSGGVSCFDGRLTAALQAVAVAQTMPRTRVGFGSKIGGRPVRLAPGSAKGSASCRYVQCKSLRLYSAARPDLARNDATMLSCAIFSSTVIASINGSTRPMLLPCRVLRGDGFNPLFLLDSQNRHPWDGLTVFRCNPEPHGSAQRVVTAPAGSVKQRRGNRASRWRNSPASHQMALAT